MADLTRDKTMKIKASIVKKADRLNEARDSREQLTNEYSDIEV